MPAVPPDMQDPAAHTLHRLSAPPISQSPSPHCGSHTALPVLPAPLPTLANNAPTGSNAGSTPHNSTAALHTPPLSHPVSAPPAPQITHGCNDPADTPAPSHSTPPPTAAAPLPPTTSTPQCAAPDPPLHPSAKSQN